MVDQSGFVLEVAVAVSEVAQAVKVAVVYLVQMWVPKLVVVVVVMASSQGGKGSLRRCPVQVEGLTMDEVSRKAGRWKREVLVSEKEWRVIVSLQVVLSAVGPDAAYAVVVAESTHY
jgi:hypothetical protein